MAILAVLRHAQAPATEASMKVAMTKPVALVTNALEFAGPPAVDSLLKAGFQVVVHDVAFTSSAARESYRNAHPEVVVLPDQTPAEIVESAWAVSHRLVVFPFGMARAAIPRLKAQAKARMVFISSNRNRLPVRGGSIPDIARAGANALVKSLSIELAPHSIPVNAIAPNYLYSEMYYPKACFIEAAAGRAYIKQTVPAGRLAQPEEIGELIAYLATMQGTFMTGAIIDFSGGWPVATPAPD